MTEGELVLAQSYEVGSKRELLTAAAQSVPSPVLVGPASGKRIRKVTKICWSSYEVSCHLTAPAC